MATATAMPTIPAPTAAAATTTATRATVIARTRFVDGQVASGKGLAVGGSMAALPSASLPMVTKAKPRERPVARSVMRATSETVPYWLKRSSRSFSVVLKERFPT